MVSGATPPPKNRLLGQEVDQRAVRVIHRQYLFGPLLYALAFGLAWLNGPASIIAELLLAFFFALPGSPLRERPPQERTWRSDLSRWSAVILRRKERLSDDDRTANRD